MSTSRATKESNPGVASLNRTSKLCQICSGTTPLEFADACAFGLDTEL